MVCTAGQQHSQADELSSGWPRLPPAPSKSVRWSSLPGWTPDGLIRQGSFKGLRPAKEVVGETPNATR
jgi:hypothetical protein